MEDNDTRAMRALLNSVKSCNLCDNLPLGPRPILQASSNARVLIAGQAPGRITHEKGIAFDDPSGKRLRDWMGVTPTMFYDAEKIAILPMGFCFPGAGKSGDLPPRSECASNWRKPLLARLPNVEFTIIIGRYAMDWHVRDTKKISLTEHAKSWREKLPSKLVLPHPSPRNNRWLKQNPWFEKDVLPCLKERVHNLLY